MKKPFLLTIHTVLFFVVICFLNSKLLFAVETPLCQLPTNIHDINSNHNIPSNCVKMISEAIKLQDDAIKQHNLKENNRIIFQGYEIPDYLEVSSNFLPPPDVAPLGSMRSAKQSDIHLEIDIHAKSLIKGSGFEPGAWLPYAKIVYTVKKVGSDLAEVKCGYDMKTKKTTNKTLCHMMAMVATDGTHYGDNVKLLGNGIYMVSITASADPEKLGYHVTTDNKVLSTKYVKDWKFTQNFLFEWNQ